jgi:hypothetical protein
LNQMPLEFDRNDENKNKSNWIARYYPNYSYSTTIWRKNYDISYLKRSNKTLLAVSWEYPTTPKDPWYKVWINNTDPYNFVYNSGSLRDLFPEWKNDYDTMYHSIPFDASYLWKSLSKTYFISENELYTYAFSRNYSSDQESDGSWKSVVATLPDLEPINNYLKVAKSTELATQDKFWIDFLAHRDDTFYLNTNWRFRILYVENNKIKVYKEELNNNVWWVIDYNDIDENYYNDSLEIIKNETEIKSLLNNNYTLNYYRLKPLILDENNNSLYFISTFVMWKPNWNQNEQGVDLWNSKVYFKIFKYNISTKKLDSFNSSNLYLEDDNNWIIWDRNRWFKIVSYLNSDSSKLMWYMSAYVRNRTWWGWYYDYSIVYDLNNKSVITKKDTDRRNYRRSNDFRPIGIHKKYGPHYFSQWYKHYQQIFYYKSDENNLDDRMEDCFTNLHFDTSSAGWIQGREIALLVTPARWFIIYTSASKITANWVTDVLQTTSYNLAEVMWVSEDDLKNKTIYVYPDPNDITKLKFDLEKDTKTNYIIEIHTSNIGIASVNLIEWLAITSSVVYVNNIFVNWAIKMIDKNTKKIVYITVEDWQIKIVSE